MHKLKLFNSRKGFLPGSIFPVFTKIQQVLLKITVSMGQPVTVPVRRFM